ncbi:MAG: 4-hydroxy-tetrahydrodipicolinate reductase [Deltaproteobacteria bacterium]|nr:4-hydroxy-tetrahydrodipicolinate reductase [Deltaproteobacteria bacterium]
MEQKIRSHVVLGINGGVGRMGKAIGELCYDVFPEGRLILFGPGGDNEHMTRDNISDCDGIIDFSSKEGFRESLKASREAGKPFVSGTTGLDNEDMVLLQDASTIIPVLWASNFSRGIAMMKKLVSIAATLTDFDVEMLEIHHNKKLDAPSGTALGIAQSIHNVRGSSKENEVYSRNGGISPRNPHEMGIMALRGGSVPGEHRVFFLGSMERLEISHSAESRSVFAAGALRTMEWLLDKKPGLYSFEDSLGL